MRTDAHKLKNLTFDSFFGINTTNPGNSPSNKIRINTGKYNHPLLASLHACHSKANLFRKCTESKQEKLKQLLDEKLHKSPYFHYADIPRIEIHIVASPNSEEEENNAQSIKTDTTKNAFIPDYYHRERVIIFFNRDLADALLNPELDSRKTEQADEILDQAIRSISQGAYKANADEEPGSTQFVNQGQLFTIPNNVKAASDSISLQLQTPDDNYRIGALLEIIDNFNPQADYDLDFIEALLENLKTYHGEDTINTILEYFNFDINLLKTNQTEFKESIDAESFKTFCEYYTYFQYGLDIEPKESQFHRIDNFINTAPLINQVSEECKAKEVDFHIGYEPFFSLEGLDLEVMHSSASTSNNGRSFLNLRLLMSPELINRIINLDFDPEPAKLVEKVEELIKSKVNLLGLVGSIK